MLRQVLHHHAGEDAVVMLAPRRSHLSGGKILIVAVNE